jgi:Na+/H+ antiporter NhaC
VAISLVGIVTGFIVVYGMHASKRYPMCTAIFLATTVLTCATGYFFPFEKVLPSHVVGAICLVILAVALLAVYAYRFAGHWRAAYVASAVAALYLNSFVLVVQAFLKVAFLREIAPTQQSPGFIIAQALLLVAFVGIGLLVLKSFHPQEEREVSKA